MKGFKLLLAAFLCLVTSGAWGQYTYVQGESNATFTWVDEDDYSTTYNGAYAKEENINGTAYPYTFQLIDNDRGLVYRMPSLYCDSNNPGDTICYVGLAGAYKTDGSSTVKDSVNIPNEITITYGSGQYTMVKKVKKIIDYGFTTSANGEIPDFTYTYPDDNTKTKYIYTYGENTKGYPRNYFYNSNLKKVTFTTPSKIEEIGMGAFQGCTNLESIVIPSSVTTIGTEAFTYCMNMTDVKFQTYTESDGTKKTHLTSIPENCFYQCNSLQALDIPEGVTSIADYAIQDCWKLKQINLPNTLTDIGEHFLCRALSLTQFYVPASVTSIEGAFLHGCENLRDVYLLGDAATLEETATNGGGTFEYEEVTSAPTVNGVNNCTFHVLAQYKSNYTSSSSVWYNVYGGEGAYGKAGSADSPSNAKISITAASSGTTTDYTHNRITWETSTTTPEQYARTFGPYKWQSVIFYEDISMSDFLDTFGDGALAATFTGCHKDDVNSKFYHFEFTTIPSTEKVPGKTPLMIYIDNDEVKYTINTDWKNNKGETSDWVTFYTKRYNVSTQVYLTDTNPKEYTDDWATMVGLAVPIPMHQNEFYFKWIWDDNSSTDKTSWKGHGEIRKSTYAGFANKSRYSCFWQIESNGIQLDGAQAGSTAAKSFAVTGFDSATGIDNVKTENQQGFDISIYDINGRLVGTSRNDLPKGLYIQGGKKFIKK